jgi:hypothetical protein
MEETLFQHPYKNQNFSIAIVPDYVLIHWAEGSQCFKYPENLGAGGLKKIFTSLEVIKNRASLLTCGILDRETTLKKLASDHFEKKLTDLEVHKLLEFFNDYNCKPPIMKDRMIAEGLGQYVNYIFSTEYPQFTMAANAFCSFVNNLNIVNIR